MDRPSEIDPDAESTDLYLRGEHIYIIVKALDAYASVMMVAGVVEELERAKHVAQILISQFPRMEFDS